MRSNATAKASRRPLVRWTGALLLGAAFLLAGAGKIAGRMDADLADLGVPLWAIPVIGIVEAVAAALLLVPRTAAYAAGGLAVLMTGAVGTHLLAGDPVGWLAPLLLGVLAITVGWNRLDDRDRSEPSPSPIST